MTTNRAWPDLTTDSLTDKKNSTIRLGAIDIPLKLFLSYCLSGNRDILSPYLGRIDPEPFRQRFLSAGTEAIESVVLNDGWVQINISLSHSRSRSAELYSEIEKLFDSLKIKNIAQDSFFMHKQPGMRVRIRAAYDSDCAEILENTAKEWKCRGLIQEYHRETYEPESTLFGGIHSMKYVHQLFSIDSIYWLRCHARSANQMEIMLNSLYLLRHLFLNLGIVDWEDIDVWDKVRSRTGRSLPDEIRKDIIGFQDIVHEIVCVWTDIPSFAKTFSPERRNELDEFVQKQSKIAGEWKRECFQLKYSGIGVRAAAALYTIFFWNRAGLTLERQTIISEALADRKIF